MSEEIKKSEHAVAQAPGEQQPRSDRARTHIANIFVLALIVWLLVAIGCYHAVAVSQATDSSRPTQEHPLLPPGVSLKATSRTVIGNLGGLPVTIPPEFARNVEYDGDPSFGEKRQGLIPVRTHQSGIRALGFELKYPDFAVTTNAERAEDKQKFNIKNTPWIRFGVTASSDFGDGQFLERSFLNMNEDREVQYEKLFDKQYGLEVYSPYTVDKSLRNYDPDSRTYRSRTGDQDLFFHRGDNGKIDVFIECSNRNHAAAPCTQYFYPDSNYRVEIHATYRRGMVENWLEIQEASKRVILNFKKN